MNRLSPSPLFAFVLATGGAGAATLAPGDQEFTLTHEQLRRSDLVHVPPQAASGKPLPVVLNFHDGREACRII